VVLALLALATIPDQMVAHPCFQLLAQLAVVVAALTQPEQDEMVGLAVVADGQLLVVPVLPVRVIAAVQVAQMFLLILVAVVVVLALLGQRVQAFQMEVLGFLLLSQDHLCFTLAVAAAGRGARVAAVDLA
jgi:hypothetical protein